VNIDHAFSGQVRIPEKNCPDYNVEIARVNDKVGVQCPEVGCTKARESRAPRFAVTAGMI
jgi:hypothetical protein